MYIYDKFQSNSVVEVHMGYSATTRGYILYSLNDKKFFLSRDVEFREFTFPFAIEPSTYWRLFPTVTIPSDVTSPYSAIHANIGQSGAATDIFVVVLESVPRDTDVRRSQRSSKAPLWVKTSPSTMECETYRGSYQIEVCSKPCRLLFVH